MSARWEENRKIIKRFLITGKLILLTPARFGGGSEEQITNMPLLRDPATNMPLLPGASIAGAMRAYLREWELGYENPGPQRIQFRFQQLFGDVVDGPSIPDVDKESRESYLIIGDSIATSLQTEYRPGVKIDPSTRLVAMDKNESGQLYDMELLQAGTEFTLCFEIALPEDEELANTLLEGTAIALTGFQRKEIGLGARKRRGFGECQVESWHIQAYDLKDPGYLIKWLEKSSGEVIQQNEIAKMLNVSLPPDQRRRFVLDAQFQLETSLLIRSGSGDEKSPDMVHLNSRRKGNPKPILSGTSLAGAIRARAFRIGNTINPANAKSQVERIFGPQDLEELVQRKAPAWASRSLIYEREVEGRNDLVQSRIRIDRFTGGTFPGALFEQQPLIGGKKSKVQVLIDLRNPQDADIGLLLHVLKDLWTGDLTLGGEASVGRGRLKGQTARLKLYSPEYEEPHAWVIEQEAENKLKIVGNKGELEKYARAITGGAK